MNRMSMHDLTSVDGLPTLGNVFHHLKDHPMSSSSNPLHVVILAAGQGKRMRSKHPKVLQPLAHRPMLAHVLDAARALEPSNIHVVVGVGADKVKAAFAEQDDLNFVLQVEQNGTGHAVQQALPHIPDEAVVLVLYGDVPLLTAGALQPLVDSQHSLNVLMARLDEPFGYGRVLLNEQGLVEAIVEQRDANEAQQAVQMVNTGVVCAQAKWLKTLLSETTSDNAQGEIYLTDVFGIAKQHGVPGYGVLLTDNTGMQGANTPEQLAQLESVFHMRQAHKLMRNYGIRMVSPGSVFVRGTVTAESDVSLDVHVIFEGDVHLGEDVQIGAFTRLKNCHLAAGTVVHSHCDLDGVVTTGACSIGPFARLRPNTTLSAGCRIGNFVETKNSRLNEGSKANHLSYVGDAVVGQRVNIGAGTITCNYDGANKHQTTLKDDAFIGSNTALVAPVTVAEGATVGAGSVITKDCPAGQLSLSRAKQEQIDGYQRPSKTPKKY